MPSPGIARPCVESNRRYPGEGVCNILHYGTHITAVFKNMIVISVPIVCLGFCGILLILSSDSNFVVPHPPHSVYDLQTK